MREQTKEQDWFAVAARGAVRVFGASPRFQKKENASASQQMKRALAFSALGVEPFEVAMLSYAASALAAAAILPLSVIIIAAFGIELFPAGFSIILLAAVAPLAVLAFLVGYPKRHAERMKVQSLGKMPEAVNYMVMAMRNTPSLDRAVGFAADNVDEPLATAIRRVIWDVYMRRYQTIEESFLAFAQEWGEWNDDFKRSLFAVRAAEMEGSSEGLQRSLDKAVDIVLSGTKRRMEGFSASLSGPTFVLFTLGILLPMMMGALLPMASMGGLAIGPWEMMLLLDIVFPLATLAFAWNILGKRPGTSLPPRIPSRMTASRRRTVVAVSIFLGIALGALALPQITGRMGDAGSALGLIPLLWAAALPAGIFLTFTSLDQKKELALIRKLEEEFPDALFQLGSRIGEGMPVETAMAMSSETLKGTEAAALFSRIAFELRLTRSTLDEVLFGKRGILADFPSRTVAASMRMVVESVKKDSAAAGQAVVGISHYLKDLRKLDSDIRIQLGSVMDTMRTTAIFFAPLVMGITAALFMVLSTVTRGIDLGGAGELGLSVAVKESVPAPLFTLIIGAYLLLTVTIIMYFTSGIRSGPDPVQRRYEIGTALPVAMAVFTLAVILGQTMIV
jgi:Flp pilus assembly protein TadB